MYNIVAYIKYLLVGQFAYRSDMGKVEKLRNLHQGERCFIVLNGPSINGYDLSPLANEITFCSNQFLRTPQYDEIKPKYYCFWDSDIMNERLTDMREYFKAHVKPAKFIFNKKLKGLLPDTEETYYIYGSHMPTKYKIRGELHGFSSSFTNVAPFAMLCAIYMGVKEIYLLGYDFAPMTNVHAYEALSEETNNYNRMYRDYDRINGCLGHWHYYLAQMQNYFLRSYADKKGCKIINMNPDSKIRCYEFGNYSDFFKFRG